MKNETLSFYITDKNNNIICEDIKNSNKKYNYILQDRLSSEMYKKIDELDNNEREEYIYNGARACF